MSLTSAQRELIRNSLETPLENLVNILTQKQWEELLELIINEEKDSSAIKNYLKPLLDESKKALGIKSAIYLFDFYTLDENTKKMVNALGGEIKNTGEWKTGVLMFLEQKAEDLYDAKEITPIKPKEEIKTQVVPEKFDPEPKASNKQEENPKTFIFTSNETLLGTVNDPEEAAKQFTEEAKHFTPNQLTTIGLTHQTFALAICKNKSLVDKLSVLQLQSLAEKHLEVAVYLIQHPEEFAIKPNFLNHLIFDRHYYVIWLRQEITPYLVSLVINPKQYDELSKGHQNKLLGSTRLAERAFNFPHEFTQAEPDLYIHYFISHLYNNDGVSRYFSQEKNKQAHTAIQNLLTTPHLRKALTSEALTQIIEYAPPAITQNIFIYITEDKELAARLYYDDLLGLIYRFNESYYEEKKETSLMIKNFIEQRGMFSLHQLFQYDYKKFEAIIFLIKNDKEKEPALLKALQDETISAKASPDQLLTLCTHFPSVFSFVIENRANLLSFDHLRKLETKIQLTPAQRTLLEKKLFEKATEEINAAPKHMLASTAMSSIYHAKAVISTGKYNPFITPHESLVQLLDTFPAVKTQYKLQLAMDNRDAKSPATKMLSDDETLKQLQDALRHNTLEKTLKSNQVSMAVLCKLNATFTPDQAKQLMAYAITHGNQHTIEIFALSNEKLALALVLNTKNWGNYVPNPSQFLQEACKKFKSLATYVENDSHLKKIRGPLSLELKPALNSNDSGSIDSSANYDYLYKFQLLGDSGVGKSGLLLRFTDNTFTESFISTIGVDFKTKIIALDNKLIKLQIWDSAGAERFRTIESNYNRGRHGVLFVFDLTDKVSFNNIKSWLDENAKRAPNAKKLILVGAKSDLVEKRVVEFDEAKEFADKNHMSYIETSAKNNINVTEVFTTLVLQVIHEMKSENKTPTMQWRPTHFSPINQDSLETLNSEFEKIHKERQNKTGNAKEKLTQQLEQLATRALALVKAKKERHKNKLSKCQYLNDVRYLYIFQNYIYDGLFSSVTNKLAKPDALRQIDKWIDDVANESIPDVGEISAPNPKWY